MLVAFVSGLLALLGAFAGGALSRRTEYEKWLRQERSTSFSRFLQAVHDTRMQALALIHEPGDTEDERAASDLRITELFAALQTQAGIVRLYLAPQDRGRFTALARELYVLHGLSTPQAHRISRIEQVSTELQAIFEASLHG
jgi:hypothetical protein